MSGSQNLKNIEFIYTNSIVRLANPHLDTMASDFLYHLDINVGNTQDTSDIQQRFGDVRVRK